MTAQGTQGDAIHPDLRKFARLLPRAATTGPGSMRVARILTALQTRFSGRHVPAESVGPISVRVHRPSSASPQTVAKRPALLWIHGGGYVIGTAAQDDALCRYFANRLGAVVAAVDYRLAPENPFPVPLEDCHDALVWLAGQPDVDPARIAIGGGSAGGGLAAALVLLARERDQVHPVLQLLVYPMLDDRTALRHDLHERNFRLWNNKANAFGWSAYTGHLPGSSEITGLAAPARHQDLSGLPPAWIGVGTLDLFHDEDLAYAERLRAAGVECAVEVVGGAFHGFDSIRPKAAVSRAFRTAQADALAAALGPQRDPPG